ncbi:helix-turn-helix domain-containing protein [Reichenbachiella sp. MALMAid0571]|uniref:helix-turn-helix domain-containing protein n=1 Tax=Reichenbachiella sp. MALMAid0571 TaxID=3143939 RepID=UPI0032DE6C31
MVFPVNGKGVVINEGLNEGLNSLLEAIRKHPGVQAKKLVDILGDRSVKTVERQISQLTDRGLVERKGSRKTGGYWLTS